MSRTAAPRGGGRSGPPPDPNALRRDRGKDQDGWTLLPPQRDGALPDWPLSEPTGREQELWEEQWSRPQAVMWERNGQEVEVALFVRALADAEMPRAPVAARTLVRQQMDSLGLTVPGLLRNRWKIGEDEVARQRRPTARRTSSAKDRLELVRDGTA